MLNVIMLNVVAPNRQPSSFKLISIDPMSYALSEELNDLRLYA
jgi:hypothetical protein